MNKVFLMGRLTRDPEMRTITGENYTAVARYTLAVDRRFKREGQPEADFFNCTSFGKQAEFVEKYLKKGTKVVVIGRLQQNNYTNKNGDKVYTIDIVAEEIEFAESKRATESSSQSTTRPSEDFVNVPEGTEEDLPFN